jgi:hypothetical protein
MALGQASRTWVSGVGDDANPCSRTAPCKTFAGAISKTAGGGEINCIDPGGFGAVTITKSITIDCSEVEAGVLVSGTSGIIINAAASDIIIVRGLDIVGLGSGQDGIRLLAGGALHVEDVRISGFRNNNAGQGNGINIGNSNANAEVTVTDSDIRDSGATNNGAGIMVNPTGSVKVTLDNVTLANNNIGLQALGAGAASTIDATGLTSTGNSFHGISIVSSASQVSAMIAASSISENGASGILCNGGSCTVRVGTTEITGNAVGTNAVGGGVIQSYQTNQIRGNTNDGTRTNISPE